MCGNASLAHTQFIVQGFVKILRIPTTGTALFFVNAIQNRGGYSPIFIYLVL
jgi:hypothetical protein